MRDYSRQHEQGVNSMIRTFIRHAALAVLASAVLLAGCRGDDGELATEHIRVMLGGADPAAEVAQEATSWNGEARPGASTSGSEVAEDGKAGSGPVLRLPDGDTVHVSAPVVDFYRSRGFLPAWTDHARLTPEGTRVLGALGEIDGDGLDPDRHGFGAARDLAQVLADGEAGDRQVEHLGDLDLLLTEAFVRAAVDLERGVLDPVSAGLPWKFERAEPDAAEVVARLARGDDPYAILTSLRPAAPYYHRLAEGLERLREVERRGGWPTVPDGETLREGDRSGRVAALRTRLLAGEDERERRLAAIGLDDPHLFDPDLREAVEHFQTRHTLHEDGAFGPATLMALNVPVGDRIGTVLLNLDRWRWLPRELGEEFLLVNVAGFELELVAGDSVIESMNVVVGRTANRTPLFRDSLQYVVVNPYWNVPETIVREEILPAVRRDPTYLARNGYEVLYNGRRLGASFVSTEALESGRYLIRQRPGPQNALGNVKFMFPNDMNIYLHDTPAGHLFSQETRAFSYGCIRVERPVDLARTLLARYTDKADGSWYDRLRQEGTERWVPLNRQIPIYILYFTAWASPDGAVRFHPDIYERDLALER